MDYFRSIYTRERFFTPSKVPKLELDLARLDDLGASELRGVTHDGRDVRCHYEGWLSVKIAEAAGADVDDGIELLNVGLHVHGSLSPGQLCHHAGITVKGEQPPLPTTKQMVDEGWADLSGERSVYKVQVSTSQETLCGFSELLLKRFHCHIVRSNYQPADNEYKLLGWNRSESLDDPTQSSFCLVMDVDLDESDLESSSWLIRPDVLKPTILVLEGWTYGFLGPNQYYETRGMADAKKVEPKTVLASRCDDMRVGMVSLYASYRQDDKKAHERLRQLDALVDEVYPATRVDSLEFVSREILSSYIMHYDPVMTQWMQGTPNRWLSVDWTGSGQNRRLTGRKLRSLSVDELQRATRG
jgi:hypothetical protein